MEKINVITIAGLLLEVSKGRWTVLERNRKLTEFHYRSMKEGETILVLLGTEYSEEPEYKSEDISKKHFHNLMEVAICREGKGKVLFCFKIPDLLRDFSLQDSIPVLQYCCDTNCITLLIGVHFYFGKNACPFSHTC